jgi:hypothetical protein
VPTNTPSTSGHEALCDGRGRCPVQEALQAGETKSVVRRRIRSRTTAKARSCSIACTSCRGRKVRCSGIPIKPALACDFCVDRNLECSLKDLAANADTPADPVPARSVLPPVDVLLLAFDAFCLRFQSCGLFNFLHPISFRLRIQQSHTEHTELLLAIFCLTLRFCGEQPDLLDEATYCNEALRLLRKKPDDYTLERMQTLLLLAFFDCSAFLSFGANRRNPTAATSREQRITGLFQSWQRNSNRPDSTTRVERVTAAHNAVKQVFGAGDGSGSVGGSTPDLLVCFPAGAAGGAPIALPNGDL